MFGERLIGQEGVLIKPENTPEVSTNNKNADLDMLATLIKM